MTHIFGEMFDHFSSRLGEYVHEHLWNYELALSASQISAEHKLVDLRSGFEEDAKRYYYPTSFTIEESYEVAKDNVGKYFRKIAK